MAELLRGLSLKVKMLSQHGVALMVIGSFVLYLLGYLALRFHLTTLGIGVDLTVLDERYLFAGAKFLVYLGAMMPSLILIVLLPGGLLYGFYCILPTRARAVLRDWLSRAGVWMGQPARLLLGGIVFSVLMIQFFMRDCFELNNLLLRSTLPADSYLASGLLRENESRIALFYLGLVAGCAVSGLVLLMLNQRRPTSEFLIFCHYLLFFLAALQLLLLPINYGYLVLDKSLPKVASLDGSTPLDLGTEAWLVWEGEKWMTYLVRNEQSKPATRMLVTLPSEQVKRIEITAYDRIFPTLFAAKTGSAL